MAESVGIKVTGLRETVKTLERLGVEVSDLKASFKRIGNLVVETAQGIVPRRSGKLASTIKASNTKNKSVVRAGAGIKYAGVIHYGWPGHNIEPHPFLTTALMHEEPHIVEALETELHGLIRGLNLN